MTTRSGSLASNVATVSAMSSPAPFPETTVTPAGTDSEAAIKSNPAAPRTSSMVTWYACTDTVSCPIVAVKSTTCPGSDAVVVDVLLTTRLG